MPTTTRFGVETTAGSDPNDFAQEMFDVAEAITSKMAGYAEGTFAARGSASSRGAGTFYRVTDNTINGGLFLSDGSTWVRLTPSPWVDFALSTFVMVNNVPIGDVYYYDDATPSLKYRVLPGNQAEIRIRRLLRFTGTQRFFGIWMQAPLSVVTGISQILGAEAMNDLARCQVYENGIVVYPSHGYNGASGSIYIGQWLVDNFARYLLVNGTYSLS